MATSDRRSRKADRKNKYERSKNAGKVAKENRAKPGYMKPAKKRRIEKRAAARKAASDLEAAAASEALKLGIPTSAAADAATVARAAVDVAAHEAAQ